MAGYSQQQMLNQNTQDFPNNNSGQITPADLRDFNANLINSVQFTDTAVPTAVSASYAATATSASYANNAGAASTAVSSSYATNAQNATTASFLTGNVANAVTAQTASFTPNAFVSASVNLQTITLTKGDGTATNLLISVSGSVASASYANVATSASFASTASFLIGGTATSSYVANALLTASAAANIITFTKFNGTTFDIVVAQSGSVASASYANVAQQAASASFATTASYASNADLLDGLNSTVFVLTSSFNSFTSSVSTNSGSVSSRLGALEAYTASMNTATSSYATKTELNAYTGSTNAFTASMKTFTGSILTSFNSYTSSINTWTGSSTAQFAGTASYATTARNVVSGLNISASNITVTNETVNGNLFVYGTASFAYTKTTTGSAVYIGDSFIVLNADAPTQPFAGIKVYDTGSGPNVTASFEWNGNSDYWITVEESGASAGILTGLSGSKGSEVFPSFNRLTKGTGNNTIVDSNITDNGTNVSINSNTTITGSLGVSSAITGNLTGTSSFANNATSASYAATAQQATSASYASTAQQATSASYAANAQQATSASFATTASYAINVTQVATGSFATTGSNTFNGNQVITGSLSLTSNINMVNGTDLVTHHVKAPSSNGVEIQNNSAGVVGLFGAGGSLGSTFYGQVNATAFSGSGTLVTGVISSSYASNAQSATSASYALTASFASNVPATASFAVSASYANNAGAAATATSASYASTAQQATSASYASTAQQATSASFATTAVSASYAPSSFDVNALYSYTFLLMGA